MAPTDFGGLDLSSSAIMKLTFVVLSKKSQPLLNYTHPCALKDIFPSL